jgi:hypothetical protein
VFEDCWPSQAQICPTLQGLRFPQALQAQGLLLAISTGELFAE